MKPLLPVIVACLLLAACNSATRPQDASERRHYDTAAPANELTRAAMADAYEQLRLRMASPDKGAFAKLLRFPVPDSVMAVYIDDEGFTQGYQAAGNMLTPALYDRYFPELAASMNLEGLTELFRRIGRQELLQNDSVRRELRFSGEPCYTFYELRRTGDTLLFTCGSDHNDASVPTEDDTEEFCEHQDLWTFRFDGRELRLVSLRQAD